MKKIFILFCCFLSSFVNAQSNYVFNVEMSDRSFAPSFVSNNGVLNYNGTNDDEKRFFDNYEIINFYQTYPNYKSNQLLNMFTFITNSSTLMNDLLSEFPTKYIRVEDLTGLKIELTYTPNDYGTTSPVPNLGANISLKSFDYVNVPKAWNYFPNEKGNVTIGISDGKVNNVDADLAGKVTYLQESGFNPTFSCGSDSWHGTSVGATAAAQGNNAHGIAGVCYDCDIMNIPYTVDGFSANFPGLMQLANSGVRVINMSWIQGYMVNDPTYVSGFILSQQLAINELHNMGVVLVAAAGNLATYKPPVVGPDWSIYCYPASYDHVISVTGVNAKNANFTDELSTMPYGIVSWYNEDLICNTGTYTDGVFSPFINTGLTTNSRVDICGPNYAPLYGGFLLGCLNSDGSPFIYANATSNNTPYVTATAALMISLNPCLSADEVENILKLSAKNIEQNPHNSAHYGKIGAGKLETGDAVEFVHEAMNDTGNALIDGQDFWRFNFDLQRIKNKLTISNQTFRDTNTSNFVAKNAIEVLQNSDFRPNSSGFVDLKIDSELTLCPPPSSKFADESIKKQASLVNSKNVKLYPNPNNGKFTISISKQLVNDISISVFDIYGKLVFNNIYQNNNFEINTDNLSSGLYLVKVSSNDLNETVKFIKK